MTKWVGFDEMSKQIKTCAVCKKEVEKGEGRYYATRLIHKKCYEWAKMIVSTLRLQMNF